MNVTEHVHAVRRQVGTRMLEAGEARTVTISRTYDAPLDDVWDACTNPDRIRRWFLPVSGDLRLGGNYQLEGNASGKIERCDPPNSFAATWEYGEGVSWIELRLTKESESGTRLQLEHIAHVDDHWAQFGPGAVGVGWDLGLLGLGQYLSSGQAIDPEQSAAWVMSDEGKQFMSLSSQRWGEADILAGADEVEARAAADRTTAAYTAGAPDQAAEC